MRFTRIIGNNCKLHLNKRSISKETLAEALGYSSDDVERLCDGRLFTTEQDVSDIAEYFGITEQELLTNQGADAYVGEGFLHCMGKFKKPENEEKILDIFDMYCDIKEVLNK